MKLYTRSIIVIAVALVAACGGGSSYGATGPTSGGTPALNTFDASPSLVFNPASMTVSAGTVVTFTFEGVTHNVTFTTSGGPADIPNSTNTSVQRTFSTPGTFGFHCTIHPTTMIGSVTVQ